MKYDSDEENSARERNNKLIQVVLVYQTDTTNNVHTMWQCKYSVNAVQMRTRLHRKSYGGRTFVERWQRYYQKTQHNSISNKHIQKNETNVHMTNIN